LALAARCPSHIESCRLGSAIRGQVKNAGGRLASEVGFAARCA
jgi:hypothetical protein